MDKFYCANCKQEAPREDLYKINLTHEIYLHWHCDCVWDVPELSITPYYIEKNNKVEKYYKIKAIKNKQ